MKGQERGGNRRDDPRDAPAREPVRPAYLRPSIPHPIHPSALPPLAIIVTHSFFARDPLAPRKEICYHTHRRGLKDRNHLDAGEGLRVSGGKKFPPLSIE